MVASQQFGPLDFILAGCDGACEETARELTRKATEVMAEVSLIVRGKDRIGNNTRGRSVLTRNWRVYLNELSALALEVITQGAMYKKEALVGAEFCAYGIILVAHFWRGGLLSTSQLVPGLLGQGCCGWDKGSA